MVKPGGESNLLSRLVPGLLNRASLPATLVGLLLCGYAAAAAEDICADLPGHHDRVKIGRYAKPPYGRYYKDPAFGARVIRITDSKHGEVHKPVYSTMQAWNADESLMLLYYSGDQGVGHWLVDGRSYRKIRRLGLNPPDIEELFWSHTEPDILYYVSVARPHQGKLLRYDVRSETHEELHDFNALCKGSKISSGNDVQMQSHDDDLFGFRCKPDKQTIMFTYRRSTDQLQVQAIGEGTRWKPWTAPAPAASGKRVLQQGQVVDAGLKTVERALDLAKDSEHSSTGRTSRGQDASFQVVFDPSPKGCNGDVWQGVSHLTEFNLETGACRAVLSQKAGWPYTTSGTHVSAVAHRRPGWVAMSSIGYNSFKYFTNDRLAPALLSEIYVVNTDPDNLRVCRLAQHRSFGKAAKNGGYQPYMGEPHATISPTGTRVLFGSDWYDSGSVDAYVVELPGYRR